MKQIKEAAQDYLLFKKQADHRDIWIGQLIAAQAAATRQPKNPDEKNTTDRSNMEEGMQCQVGLGPTRNTSRLTTSNGTYRGPRQQVNHLYRQRTN